MVPFKWRMGQILDIGNIHHNLLWKWLAEAVFDSQMWRRKTYLAKYFEIILNMKRDLLQQWMNIWVQGEEKESYLQIY